MNSPRDILKPWLFALLKPIFSELRISTTSGKEEETISTDPSAELLSTTIISACIFEQALWTEVMACLRKSLTL